MKPSSKCIDLITPAFNSGELLLETVRSVAASRVENLKYTVWDGNGTDGSCEEASKVWGSGLEIHRREDSGQYDALKKGFNRMTGDVMGWINAGDILFPWTLKAVSEIFDQFPEVEWIYGRPCSGAGTVVRQIRPLRPIPREIVRLGLCCADGLGFLAQEATFWRRSLYERVGGISNDFELAADFDLWTRFANFASPVACPVPLAMFAQHGDNRSQSLKGKAVLELESWLNSLDVKSREQNIKLAARFRLVRRSRAFGAGASNALFRFWGLDRFKGRMLEWNSRKNTNSIRDVRLSADHLA